MCTGLDLGGSIPDGLASCGGGPSDRPSRSLRVAPAGFRPGTRPAHSGPARGSVDLISPQMLGELLGGVLAPPVRVEYRLPPVVCGRLRAAISIASHARGRCRVLSPQSRTRLLSSCSSPGTVARYTNPSQVRIQVDVAHPLHSRPVGGGSPAGPGRGASPGPGGRDGGAGSFRRGCAAWRALLTHDGCAAPCPGSSQRLCGPRRRGPFGTRRVPRELLKTHSIKALSSFLRRTVLDGSRPSQA